MCCVMCLLFVMVLPHVFLRIEHLVLWQFIAIVKSEKRRDCNFVKN